MIGNRQLVKELTDDNDLLEDSKDEADDEAFQNAIRAVWEEHDAKIEALQQEQQVSARLILD